jgi:predicted ATPase
VAELPTGTVTFLFTDVEGSTRLLHELGDAYAGVLGEHRRVLRNAFTQHGGVEVDTQGDAFFVAFPKASDALAAAAAGREALDVGPIKVRMGLHTGEPLVTADGYVGMDVHRAARIAAAGHGGQILLSQTTRDLAQIDGILDLGEHRLKDLGAAERLYQLGSDDFPPLKTLHQTNLPISATAFLGRERELGEVAELLRRADVRLLTLTGPGGTGKTRLALQAAAVAADLYPHGVWWVPLAPIRDATLVLSAAMRAIGASEELAGHVGDKHMLLLFDNFEHLLGSATDIGGLIASCPNLDVLVTSRTPLHLDGEWDYEVAPLREEEAVALFTQRARAARRDFETGTGRDVREICARLDHLPLAVELAAARVKVLGLADLLDRLEQRLPLLAGGPRNAPERQRTLRATIEWSYDLLSPDEQLLFTRLAIFVGGFTFAAAEAVSDADLDTLEALVEKSLVRRSEGGRLAMLETIREYASDQLVELGADRIAQRHAHFFAELVETIAEDLSTGRHEAMEAIAVDYPNVRQALEWLHTTEPSTFARTAADLRRFWIISADLGEGGRWLELAVTAADSTEVRSTALAGLIGVVFDKGDAQRAKHLCEERLELCRTLGDIPGVIRCTGTLGSIAAQRRDFATADALIAEAIALAESSGDDWAVATGLINRVAIATESGDWPGARTLSEEALVKAREVGDEEGIAIALWSLGFLELREGRLGEAHHWLAESLQVCVSLHATRRIADCLLALSVAAGENKQGVRAARLLAKAETLREETGGPWEGVDVGLHENATHAVATQLAAADAAVARTHGEAMSLEAAVNYAVACAD